MNPWGHARTGFEVCCQSPNQSPRITNHPKASRIQPVFYAPDFDPIKLCFRDPCPPAPFPSSLVPLHFRSCLLFTSFSPSGLPCSLCFSLPLDTPPGGRSDHNCSNAQSQPSGCTGQSPWITDQSPQITYTIIIHLGGTFHLLISEQQLKSRFCST